MSRWHGNACVWRSVLRKARCVDDDERYVYKHRILQLNPADQPLVSGTTAFKVNQPWLNRVSHD